MASSATPVLRRRNRRIATVQESLAHILKTRAQISKTKYKWGVIKMAQYVQTLGMKARRHEFNPWKGVKVEAKTNVTELFSGFYTSAVAHTPIPLQ